VRDAHAKPALSEKLSQPILRSGVADLGYEI